MMVRLFTAAILALMLFCGNSTSASCNEDLHANDENSDYPVVELEAVCSETAITVTYEAQATDNEFSGAYGLIDHIGYNCRNTTGSLVDKGSVYGEIRQEPSHTAKINSATFPVGTHCAFNGCYSYLWSSVEYSFQEISCTILGPGYECSDDADCSLNAMCTIIDEETECECTGGYEKSGSSCININECTLEMHQCGDNAACSDTEGSYNCTCISGYEGDGINCTNIDECTLEMHQCGDSAACSDTEGDYNCTCISGYEGDGVNCTDIDECAQTGTCSKDAICTNTEGGYNCTCMQGYDDDGLSCIAEGNGGISIAYGFGGIVLALSACVVVFALIFYLVRKRTKLSYGSAHNDIFSDIWKQPVDENFFPVDYIISPTLQTSFDCESFFNELEYTIEPSEVRSIDHNEIANSGTAMIQYDLDTQDSGISNLSNDYIDTHADILSSQSLKPVLSTEPQSSSDDAISPAVQDTSVEKCNNEPLSHQGAKPCEFSKDSCISCHCCAEDCSCCSRNENSEIDVVNDTSSTYYEDLFWQEELYRPESVCDKKETESTDERGYI